MQTSKKGQERGRPVSKNRQENGKKKKNLDARRTEKDHGEGKKRVGLVGERLRDEGRSGMGKKVIKSKGGSLGI